MKAKTKGIQMSGALATEALRVSWKNDSAYDFLRLASLSAPSMSVLDLFLIVTNKARIAGSTSEGFRVEYNQPEVK